MSPLGETSSNTFPSIPPLTWHDGYSYLTDSWADTDIHWDGDSWNDPGLNMYGCLKQLNLLKRRNRNLKVLLSIGGWTYSPNFAAPASTPAGRACFSRTAVQLVKDMGFDGLDIDWEYPKDATEAANLVELLRETREALDAYANSVAASNSNTTNNNINGAAYHFELTVACPAAARNYQIMDLPGMDRYLDFWNLMAYDFAGSWDSVAGHQANLFPSSSRPAATPYSVTGSVDGYISGGIAPDKIVVGMPLYGRSFENTDGPGMPFSGIGEGSWEPGVYDYKALPLPGATEFEDNEAGASWCYDPGKRVMVSYDTVSVAAKKADFITERRLGGAMWWESSSDKAGSESLTATVVGKLGGTGAMKKQVNCIHYPASKYDNLRNGFGEK